MDFFDQQDRAHRKTRFLLLWFAAAVAGVIGAVYLAVLAVLGSQGRIETASRPELFLTVAVAVASVIGVASLYKILALREGGEAVARMLGGRPVDPNTTSAAERRLLNVVEEMAIAAGVPVPTVFLLERERGINAFAAGFTSGDAVIGVTRGAVELLDRDELQGVIAHEFSHILNGDMRLNLRLMGLLHGILVISLIGYWILRGSSYGDRRGRGGAALLLFGAALWAIGAIGVLFARLIKSGVSRQRELLADASAVQFTRNPPGLADALRKIGGLAAGSKVQASQAEQASHMFFGDGLHKKAHGGWLSTHPPLEARIRALDPGWDGRYPKVEAPTAPGAPAGPRTATPVATAAASALAAPPPLPAPPPFDAAAATERVGRILHGALEHAAGLVATLPEPLRRDVREPAEAEALIYALLLHTEPDRRALQIAALEASAGERASALLASVARCARALRASSELHRLPLVDLALPALRRMSEDQYRAFMERVRALVTGDGSLRLFEFTLQRMLARHLEPHFERPESSRVQYYSLRGVAPQCATLLSALAHLGGNRDPQAAFAAGAARLDAKLGIELLPAARCRLVDVDQALRALSQVAPRHKRSLVEAIAATIAWDRQVTVPEVELLRAICDTLDVPLPPYGTKPGSRSGGSRS
ncbi:MAG TPA: M48 family metallopeptidase [Thermoanaerobaculia bacterium]|nr:M48 family metallopeptidase [Thermoanaerobaculia bacterium]